MNTEDLLIRWLAWKETNQGASLSTVNQYRLHIERLIAWCRAKGISPLEPSQDHLEEFAGAYLFKERGMSARSRRPVISALKGWFRWLNQHGIIQSSPDKLIHYPRAGKPLPVAMSLQVAEKLMWAPDLSTFIGVRDAAMLSLLIGCGPRISGLVALNESALLFSQEGDRETLTIKVIEKGDRERLIPAPDEARLLVRAYLGHPDLPGIDRTLPDGDCVLFVSVGNRYVPAHEYHGEARRMSTWSVRKMLISYGTEAGLDRAQLRPHAARHLYGTELAEQDVDLLVRQQLLGHSTPTSTRVYTQLAQRKLRSTVDKANPLGRINTPVSDLVKHLR